MRTTILSIQKLKDTGQRVPMLTAYDATSARLVEAAGVPIILVGDSLGMTIQGHETTVPVTLDDMIYHTRAVVRGTSKAMIVFDLPFMTYTVSPEQALASAGRAIQEGGATAVKMEGGAHIAPTVARVVEAGIPVMAHIGLTPQSVYQLGGWRIQGRDAESARRLIDDALALEQAGAFAIVLETVPVQVAKEITARLHIPTIGIGAGPHCDGQVQVFHDVLGLIDNVPKHAKKYANLGDAIRQAVSEYVAEVQSGSFPTEAQSFTMDESALAALYGNLQGGNGGGKKAKG
jgi:3-methyl-2-oxobutanoate hydroxymethyltransferase